jgi:retron-type reverse transcriptase
MDPFKQPKSTKMAIKPFCKRRKFSRPFPACRQRRLTEAFHRVRRNSAPGVDGQTVDHYEEHLEANLSGLLNRAKSGAYEAPPVRRVYVPKDNGESRPIGIPTTEDKVLGRAIVMLLEPIYEGKFYDFSYGFRPGRSAHQALQAFWQQASDRRVRWVLEVDIRKYFDSVSRSRLFELISANQRGIGLVSASNTQTHLLPASCCRLSSEAEPRPLRPGRQCDVDIRIS